MAIISLSCDMYQSRNIPEAIWWCILLYPLVLSCVLLYLVVSSLWITFTFSIWKHRSHSQRRMKGSITTSDGTGCRNSVGGILKIIGKTREEWWPRNQSGYHYVNIGNRGIVLSGTIKGGKFPGFKKPKLIFNYVYVCYLCHLPYVLRRRGLLIIDDLLLDCIY